MAATCLYVLDYKVQCFVWNKIWDGGRHALISHSEQPSLNDYTYKDQILVMCVIMKFKNHSSHSLEKVDLVL